MWDIKFSKPLKIQILEIEIELKMSKLQCLVYYNMRNYKLKFTALSKLKSIIYNRTFPY